MSMDRFGDKVCCNPNVKLKKQESYPVIDIDKITPGYKAVRSVASIEYTGQGGAKFQDHDVLFARITPCLENGKMAIADTEGQNGIGSTYLSRDSLVFSNIVKRIIESGIIEGIDVHYIISTLFTLLSPEEVKTIIHNAPSETVDFWLFAYYCEIPSEAIDTAKVEELYAYLKCDYDREIHTAGYRSLKFLERYESVESDIIINAARLIFAKKDYSRKV